MQALEGICSYVILHLTYLYCALRQSPVELLNGIAQGSKTLIGSTVYAVSSATSHFSKTAYKVLCQVPI